jgi:hypothetical protein
LVDSAFCHHEVALGKTPVQTVRADFPHTAFRWSLVTLHYEASG